MSAQMWPSTRSVGFWGATLATVFSLAYVVGQLAEWFGWLGSAGGPESSSTALGIAVLLIPSLLLAPAFVLMLIAMDQATSPERKVWSRAAVAFGTVYAVMISINYYVQLAWVMPHMMQGDVRGLEPFLFTPFNSFLYAVDILGYSFMSAATLCAAMAMDGSGLQGRARWFLLANGAVMPFLLFQMYYHPLIWIASAWAVTFPASTWTVALIFRRATPETRASFSPAT